MNKDELPNDPVALKELVVRLSASNEQLASTVDDQRKTIEKKDVEILELLRALRGKQRERLDPDQLVLFELGELETIAKEETEVPRPNQRRKKRHGRRLIPDNLPSEEVIYELPEAQRLCPHDGRPKSSRRRTSRNDARLTPRSIRRSPRTSDSSASTNSKNSR